MSLPLSILLWLPALGGLLALLVPAASRAIAIVATALAAACSVLLVADFDSGARGLQYVTDFDWISTLGIHYKLGVDGLNVFLILLTCVLFLASTVWAAFERREREGLFLFHLGVGQTAVLGALLAQDLALFVAFFDLMLIPFFFLTGIWGTANRVQAVTKLVIYTLVGSLLMLAAAIATAVLSATQSGNELSFAFSDLQQIRLSSGSQDWIFLFFAAAFLVKMPAFPLHGWMPDGYGAMPLPVLAVFSAVLSKVAAYGFLRIVLPLFPDASAHFQDLLLLIALASILYGSVMAFTQTNARLILGYSSLAQLGFIVLGIFSLNGQGAQGALLQSFNHGLVVAPAFFIVALLAARSGSEDIRDMGGLAFRAPALATLFLVVAMANLAIPGSSNFAGEFLILLGVFQTKLVFAIVASAGVALAAVYTLRLFIRTMHNRRSSESAESREITLRDGIVLIPLVAAIVALAFYPQLPLKKSDRAVAQTVVRAQAATGDQPVTRAERTVQEAPTP